ncbi:MAG: aminoglycoside phosphotransferase family protein [Acidimicrobiales bacterium]
MSRSGPLVIPPALRDGMQRFGSVTWLEGLPAMVEEAADLWDLEVGEPFLPGGLTSWVAPARTAGGRELVLKITWAHFEGLHEAEGLSVWDGHGAIRLEARADFETARGLLLERCVPGTPLAGREESDQDGVIAGLLQRLWAAPTGQVPFRPLTDMCDQWTDEFEQKLSAGPIDLDAGLVRSGAELFRELPRSADHAVLLCTDLHAGNVLASQRQPWLMIDPKPYVGDPAYDVLQHLLNGEERLATDPRGAAEHMADLLDLDRARVTAWLFARSVMESVNREDLCRVATALSPT